MAADQTKAEWTTFIGACFRNRLSRERFSALSQTFAAKHQALPYGEAGQILLEQGCHSVAVDPRLPGYLEILLDAGSITLSGLLSALWATSTHGENDPGDEVILDDGDSGKPTLQTVVFQLLTRRIANGEIAGDSDLFDFLKTLMPWLARFPASVPLGFLVSATLGCPVAQDILPAAQSKKFKASFGHALAPLIDNLSQQSQDQLAGALKYWQQHYQLHDEISAESMDLLNDVGLGTLTFQQGVMDSEPLNTRAGLYIGLNALLCERPMFDDMTMMNYLNIRYQGNVPTLVTDLILASFDILANAMYRTESSQSITILRSFLVNKLPAFLINYAAIIFPPLSIETCIGQALLRIDPAAFPSFSQMFDLLGKNGVLSEARQEFLFACALHQLIPEGSIEGLLGDVPMQSLPAGGRYVKTDLVAQCTANPSRIEDLVGELENMEGNAGEIAGALVEIITTLCTNNDTMTLKGICNCLTRKPATLDVVALFCSPQTLLQPLCQLLDNWQEHEDQESQPVYEEFGSVLLLVSVMRHRFDLDLSDLGDSDRTHFTAKYFQSASVSRPTEDLSEHEKNLLGGWIRGLFETEGINDELMSMCKPAEFHLLVATLFDQSIKACQARVLSMDTLKGGLEYLLEPFLLPSLTATLSYCAHALWAISVASTLADTLVPALHTLLKPSSMSSEAAAMHSAVLETVSGPLDEALAHVQNVHRLRVDIQPLQGTLKQHGQKHRHDAAAYTELEGWSTAQAKGLQSALGSSVRRLLVWALSDRAGTAESPPNYSHRLLRHCIHFVGAKAIFTVLLDELLAQAEGDDGQKVDILLDIVVTMIVPPAPSASSAASGRLTLQDVLRIQFSDANELSKTDEPRARMIVRLHRRVEASAGATVNVGDVQMGMEGDMGGGGGMVLDQSVEGMPTGDIDDVLAHTEERIKSGDFLGAGMGEDGFLGIG